MEAHTFFCLGIEALGRCKYDPSSSFSLLSFGEAVQAVTFLIAFTQVLRPVDLFKFRVKYYRFKWGLAWPCGALIASVFFTLVAKLLLAIQTEPLPILGYPIFWEFWAAFMIMATITDLVITFLCPTKFIPRNAKIFLDQCCLFIGRGSEAEICSLAREIGANVPRIMRAFNEYDSHVASMAKEKEAEDGSFAFCQNAHFLIAAFSDPLFCKVLVCQSPVTAYGFITEIQKQSADAEYLINFIHQLIKQALRHKDSALYKEEKYQGLGYFRSFTNLCFGNYDFIEKFRVMEALRYWQGDITEWQMAKYAEMVEEVLKAYFEAGCFSRPWPLKSALETLTNTARNIVWKNDEASQPGITHPEYQNILMSISQTLQNLVNITIVSFDKIPKGYSFSEEDDLRKRNNDSSIYEVIAKAMFNFLEALSATKKYDENLRIYGITIWLIIFSPISSRTEEVTVCAEIRKRLEWYILEKLGHNLEQGFYPPITRTLIALLGLYESPQPATNPDDQFKQKFLSYLRTHFEKAVEKFGDRIFRDMLPADVQYDRERGILTERLALDKECKFNLREVPASTDVSNKIVVKDNIDQSCGTLPKNS